MLIKLKRQSHVKESFIPYDDRAVIALLEVEKASLPTPLMLISSMISVNACKLSFKLPLHYDCPCICMHSGQFKNPFEMVITGQRPVAALPPSPKGWRHHSIYRWWDSCHQLLGAEGEPERPPRRWCEPSRHFSSASAVRWNVFGSVIILLALG